MLAGKFLEKSQNISHLTYYKRHIGGFGVSSGDSSDIQIACWLRWCMVKTCVLSLESHPRTQLDIYEQEITLFGLKCNSCKRI